MIQLQTPSICKICKRDWEHGACGDCTLTREQLNHVLSLDAMLAAREESTK